MKDFPISELRLVSLFIKGSSNPTIHMCHESQVELLVKASINLHHLRLENLWFIRVQKLELETRSYWWCTENLDKNHDPNGAQLNYPKYSSTDRVWAHPDLLKEEREAERQEILWD